MAERKREPIQRRGIITLLFLCLGLALGCGGGSKTSGKDPGKTLTSVVISPTNSSVAVAATLQFKALGNYTDGSSQDVTSSANWSSSDATKATIESSGQATPGLATGIAVGSVTITAAFGGQQTTTTLTVSSSGTTLTSLNISPPSPIIAVGVTQQFFANAMFSDGTGTDVTRSAAWTSSDTTKAAIQTTGQTVPGLATGMAVGSVSITAVFSGLSATTTLTIGASGGGATKIPLMDMTAVNCLNAPTYQSFQGGLYENCSDNVPIDHGTDGTNFAAQVQPLDTNGKPNSSGKIVFTSIGMSNAMDEFGRFIRAAAGNSGVNQTTLLILNGAAGGILANCWTVATGPPSCGANVENQYDRVRDTVLAPAGVTEAQVQVVWIKEADGGPGEPNQDCGSNGCAPLCDPSISGCLNATNKTEALRYEAKLGEILRAAKTRWPNLKLAFLASRVYAGYATIDLNPEPYAYEYGYSVKWEIEAQINQIRTGTVDSVAGDLNYNGGMVPWIAWGPYLWANDSNPRSDGLIWCDGQSNAPCNGEIDFLSDGTHPNATGQDKVANMLMNFFLTSPWAPWFRP